MRAKRHLIALLFGWILVLLLAAVGAPGSARAEAARDSGRDAARVVSASGDTRLVRPSSILTPLQAGEVIRAGDRVATGADASLSLRFSDASLLTLGPGSEYRIEGYRYEADSHLAVFTLMRGVARVVSGAIGKRDPADWKLTTPTATIGIRGTDFEVREESAGLTVSVFQGRVAVSNEAGSVEVPEGQSVRVRDRLSAPQLVAAVTRASAPAAAPASSARPAPAASGARRTSRAQGVHAPGPGEAEYPESRYSH